MYPLGFIFTLAYNVIALRSAINMSDDNLIFVSCAKGICNQYVKYVEKCRKAKKVVNAFHVQFVLRSRNLNVSVTLVLYLHVIIVFNFTAKDGFIAEFINCLTYIFGKWRGGEMITLYINFSLGKCKIKSLVFCI